MKRFRSKAQKIFKLLAARTNQDASASAKSWTTDDEIKRIVLDITTRTLCRDTRFIRLVNFVLETL